jgi:hypothetical protein
MDFNSAVGGNGAAGFSKGVIMRIDVQNSLNCAGVPETLQIVMRYVVRQAAAIFLGRRGTLPGCIQYAYVGEPPITPQYYEFDCDEGMNDTFSFFVSCYTDPSSALNNDEPVMTVYVIVSSCAEAVIARR